MEKRELGTGYVLDEVGKLAQIDQARGRIHELILMFVDAVLQQRSFSN